MDTAWNGIGKLDRPAAWFVNSLMLQRSAGPIALGPGIFGVGLAVMLGFGLTTRFSQTYRATSGNPLESLRDE